MARFSTIPFSQMTSSSAQTALETALSREDPVLSWTSDRNEPIFGSVQNNPNNLDTIQIDGKYADYDGADPEPYYQMANGEDIMSIVEALVTIRTKKTGVATSTALHVLSKPTKTRMTLSDKKTHAHRKPRLEKRRNTYRKGKVKLIASTTIA